MDHSTNGPIEPEETNPALDGQQSAVQTDGATRDPVQEAGEVRSERRPRRPVRVMGDSNPRSERAPERAPDLSEPPPPTTKSTTQVHKMKPDLRSEEHVKGSHPGDRYIRYGRNVGPFKRKGGGVLAASL